MKKIYLLFALAIGLVSCDMEKMPYDSIIDTEALTTPDDFTRMRVGLYSGLRASIGGDDFYSAPEIQSDGFHAVVGFSNNLGQIYRWMFTSDDGTFSGVYGNYQALISRSNFLIDGYNKCNMSKFTEDDIISTKRVKGEAFFVRAYSIFMLSQYFCADYEASTANQENTGVSYRLDYAPSSNASTYPGRNTLAKTMQQVRDDLDSAAVYINVPGAPSKEYISSDAIVALRARVALAMDDYDTAAAEAEKVITSGNYALASDIDELEDLWYNDGGMETIFQLAIPQKDELAAQTGKLYQPYSDGSVPDYIPTQTLLDLYDMYDYRFYVYFNELDIVTNAGVSGTVFGLNKCPDHTRLWNSMKSEASRFVIEPKVIRLAEMYLIAAEAYAQKNDIEKASLYLNELMASRIFRFTDRSYPNKESLMAELKDERQREMVLEGSRLFDIKRWHEGVKRGVPQNEALCLLPGATTTTLTRSANDPRLVWPIPKHETDANPQVVQNPGY